MTWLGRSRAGVLKVALPVAAALGAGAAFAVAAIPGSDHTITGCYWTQTSTPAGGVSTVPYGTLRVIDPSASVGLPAVQRSCLAGEATIAWGQTGPPGPPGTPGTAGARGADGRSLIVPQTLQLTEGGGQNRLYLRIAGIKGESQDKGHKGDIQLLSYRLTSLRDAGGGQATGKRTHPGLVITKYVDKSSPALFKTTLTGKHIAEAQIFLARKAGRGQQDFLRITFSSVLVSSLDQGISGGKAPRKTETITFDATGVAETFLGHAGKPLGTVKVKLGLAG